MVRGRGSQPGPCLVRGGGTGANIEERGVSSSNKDLTVNNRITGRH